MQVLKGYPEKYDPLDKSNYGFCTLKSYFDSNSKFFSQIRKELFNEDYIDTKAAIATLLRHIQSMDCNNNFDETAGVIVYVGTETYYFNCKIFSFSKDFNKTKGLEGILKYNLITAELRTVNNRKVIVSDFSELYQNGKCIAKKDNILDTIEAKNIKLIPRSIIPATKKTNDFTMIEKHIMTCRRELYYVETEINNFDRNINNTITIPSSKKLIDIEQLDQEALDLKATISNLFDIAELRDNTTNSALFNSLVGCKALSFEDQVVKFIESTILSEPGEDISYFFLNGRPYDIEDNGITSIINKPRLHLVNGVSVPFTMFDFIKLLNRAFALNLSYYEIESPVLGKCLDSETVSSYLIYGTIDTNLEFSHKVFNLIVEKKKENK